jgi:hypothetical protein
MEILSLKVRLKALALESECLPKTIATTKSIRRGLAALSPRIEAEGHRITQGFW